MAGNKTVYTLDLDTSKLISKYKDAISQMEKAGVSGDITKGLTQGLEKLEKEYKNLETAGKAGFTNSKQIENFQKRVEKLMTSFRGFESELGGVGDKIGKIAKKSEEANKKLSGAFSKFGFKDVAKQMNEINKATDKEAKLSDIVKAELEARAKAVADLKVKYEQAAKAAEQASTKANSSTLGAKQNSKYTTGESVWTGGKNKVDNSVKQTIVEQATAIAKAAKDGQAAWTEFNNYLKANGLDKAFNQRALPQLEQSIKDMQANFSAAAPAIEQATKAQEELNRAETDFNKIGKQTKDGIVARKDIYTELKSDVVEVKNAEKGISQVMEDSKASALDLANAENQASKAAKDVTGAAISEEGAVTNLTTGLQNTAEAAEKTASTFEQLKSRLLMFFSVTSIFNSIRNEIKKTYEDVKTLDKSFASIAMVTKYSVNEMWSSYSLYADMASQLGQKTNDVIQASALFYQQGLDTNEALALTTDTMKLATLAGTDFSSATQEMTSAIRGFKMEMDEGGRVADVYSNLAAHAAASVDDIAQAMARTASIANSAGMSFENTSAFLTQMIETTQESAENIGTSLKTIIARFTELKENVAGTADSEFEDLDYNKVDKALKSVGVSLKDATGQFRNLDEVFLELSEKWNTLDRNTQRYVATIAAGSRQQSRFIAMMDNYERTAELMEYATDAEGKADEQFAKYADTMEYKLNQLSTSWEEFRVKLMDSDLFKGVVDGLNKVVQIVSSIDLNNWFDRTKFLATIGIIVISVKNLIKTIITTVSTTVGMAKKLGSKFAQNFVAGAKTKLSRNSHFQKLFKITPELELKLLDKEIKEAEEKLYNIKRKFESSGANKFITKYGMMKEGEDPVAYIQRLKTEGNLTEGELREIRAELQQLGNGNTMQGLIVAMDQYTQATKEGEQATEQYNNAQKQREQIQQQNQKSAQLMQNTSMLLTASLSAGALALTAYISGAMSFGQAMGMMAKSIAPVLISLGLQVVMNEAVAFAEKKRAMTAAVASGTITAANAVEATSWTVLAGSIWAALAPLLLVAAAIGAVVLAAMGIAAVTKAFNAHAEALNEAGSAAKAVKQAEEDLADAKEKATSAKNEAKEKKDEYEATKALKEEYVELASKASLLPEQEERLQEIQNEIQEQFPEIITGYDEQNNRLEVAVDLWDAILEKQKASAQNAQRSSTSAQFGQIAAEQRLLNAQMKQQAVLEKSASDLIAQENKSYTTAMKETAVGMGKTVLYTGGAGTPLAALNGIIAGNKARKEAKIQDEQLVKMGKVFRDFDLEGDADYLRKVLKKNDDERTEEEKKALSAYDNMVKADAASRERYQKKQEELLKKQQEAVAKELFDSNIDYGDVTDEVKDGVSSFLANVSTSLSDSELGTYGIGNSNGANRGYFANKLSGGVKGRNKDSSNRGFTGNNLDSWDKMDSEIREILELGGMDEDTYNKNRKGATGIESIYQVYLQGLRTKALEEYGQELANSVNEEALNIIGDFGSNGNNKTLDEWNAYTEKVKSANGGVLSADMKDALDQQYNNMVQERHKYLRDGDNALIKIYKREDGTNTTGFDFKEFTAQQLSDFQNYSKAILSAAGEENRDVAENYLNTIFQTGKNKDIAPEQMVNFLKELDWSEVSSLNAEEFSEKWISQIQTTFKMTKSEAQDFYNDLKNMAEESGLGNTMIATMAQINTYIEKTSAIANVFKENGDTISEFMSRGAESVELTSAEYDKMSKVIDGLVENGVTEAKNLVKYNEATGKWVLNTEELGSLMDKNTEEVEKQLKLTKQNNNARLTEIDTEIKSLEAKEALTEEDQKRLEELKTEKTTIEASNDAINDSINEVKTLNAQVAQTANYWKSALGQLDKLSGKISSISSAFSSMSSDGFMSASSITSLSNAGIDVSKYIGRDLKLNTDAIYKDMLADIDSKFSNKDFLSTATEQEKLQLLAYRRELMVDYNEYQEKIAESGDKVTQAEKKWEDAEEALAKQQQEVIDKQNDLNEKIKEYAELIYGTNNRKSSLDVLYNYTEAINSFSDEISRSKELLADSKSIEDSTSALTRYTQATHNLLVEEKAKQEVIKAGLSNFEDIFNKGTSYTDKDGNTIDVNFNDYIKKDARTNKYIIDQRLLNEAKFADTWKDYLEEQVSNYNKYSEELLKSEDEVRKQEKELEDERNAARQKYVAMEKEIADALKQQYQDEVDALQSKYDSMKDADDDYLDALQEAIDKQRKLRDQENAYEDLAKQEKKLSLMQRDTSGANALEVQNLEEDIQKSREDLLDEAIDNVIDGLSKLYESQEELRNEEMELKQALLDNTLYWNQQAENLAGSFENADEYAAYLSSISKEYADMTLTMQQDKLAEYGDTYTQATEYMAMVSMDSASETHDFINDTVTTTGEEIAQVVTNTAETFSTEVIRSYNATTEAFLADMQKAELEIKNANDALQEAYKKLNECADAANRAATELNNARAAANGGDAPQFEDEIEDNRPEWEKADTITSFASALGVNGHEIDDMSHKAKNDSEYYNMIYTAIAGRNDLTDEQMKKFFELLSPYGIRGAATYFISDINHNPNMKTDDDIFQALKKRLKFAEGGLVNFTGPAWVDGQPDKPEAFLSAEDTENIGNAAKILADIPWLDRTTSNGQVITNNGGDVSVEINLNIDHISSETDIDEMLERVKEEIVEVARPAGTNTILQQEI